MNFNDYKVQKIVQETDDTRTFYLDVNPELRDFKAGQYITISAMINGEEIRRSYSLCTAPFEELFGFTIKRVKGGIMSNYLHDQISEGDNLSISGPEGKFIIEPQADIQRDHYFFAAGSGITPVMAMIKTILKEEPMSTCYLLYGSRSEKQIIFKDQLKKMQNQHTDQFYLVHTLSQPLKEKVSGLSGIFGKTRTAWTGEKGRISSPKIKDFISKYTSKSGRSSFYLCGPGSLIEEGENTLLDLGEAKENIYKEFFTTKISKPGTGNLGSLTIELEKQTHVIQIQADETILEAALRENLDAPHSCTSGACSSCLAKLSKGEVKMDVCYALEDDEIEDGYILTCQARLISDSATLTYDV